VDGWIGIISAIWLIGAWIRVCRQARFYQIEEYMSLRYLRWIAARRCYCSRPSGW
jgi:hypothetical protein